MSPNIKFIPRERIQEVARMNLDPFRKAAILADMCRINTFSTVKRAGSGHLGTSFSAMDIFIWLFYNHLNTIETGFDSPDRDIFFSSKGHDVPGLYGVFYALGIIPLEKLLNFRRLGGLDGHPDISLPGIEANTGSLGMGISKAKGMAWAKKRKGQGGRIFVMTGDGELQEGQIYESMQTAVHQKVNNITVIVDHNKCQTENPVENVISLGDLEAKFRAFGWHVDRCDGHSFQEIDRILKEFEGINDQPKILIADTIKGRGISFMEHPFVLKEGNGKYKFHAGAPVDEEFNKGIVELQNKADQEFETLGLIPIEYIEKTPGEKKKSSVSNEFTAISFTDALMEVAERRKDVVLLDADLLGDARLQRFAEGFPDQFIENGIAEQDMVSTAGGLALQGMLPFVNSFASFLCARGNEQIYNNATEKTKIIYINLYAGLIPAGPGKSHQSLRDIALMGTLPNMTIVHPGNALETREMVKWCADIAEENCAIRLTIGPSPRIFKFDANWKLEFGRGTVLREGYDAVIFAYGPVMLHEALKASEILFEQGFQLKVVDMPWLNRFDVSWLKEALKEIPIICVLEDHGSFGGLADHMLPVLIEADILGGQKFNKIGINTMPMCGTPPEVLRHHGVDGESVAKVILAGVKN
jgi:transketolase